MWFTQFRSWKRSYTFDAVFFVWQFRKEKCHRVPDPKLDIGLPGKGLSALLSCLASFVVIICRCINVQQPIQALFFCSNRTPVNGTLHTGTSWLLGPRIHFIESKLLICKTAKKSCSDHRCLSSSNRMVRVKVFYKHTGDCNDQKLLGEMVCTTVALLGTGTRLLQVFWVLLG